MTKQKKSNLEKIAKAGVLAGGLLCVSAVGNDLGVRTNISNTTNKYVPSLEIVQKQKEVEYLVPRKVFDTFARIVDPKTVGVRLGGGYLGENFLVGDKKSRFVNDLLLLGYSNSEVKTLEGIFEGQNIVFPEDVVTHPDFKDFRKHERMHKMIHDLPIEDRNTLNEARNFIVNEYLQKQLAAGEEIDVLYRKTTDKAVKDSLVRRRSELLKISNPILLGSDKVALRAIYIDPPGSYEEFYPYLFNRKLNPRAETTVREKFPRSARIYEGLKIHINEVVR